MSRNYDLMPLESAPELPQMIAAPQPQEEPGTNPLLGLHKALKGRYWWAIPLGLVLAVAGAVGGYKAMPPQYTSTGLIQIRPVVPQILRDQNTVMPMFESFVASQAMLIQSERVVAMAMQHPEWQAQKRGVTPAAIRDFNESLQVQHPRGSEMIVVSFQDRDPAAATVAVRATTESYLKIFGESDAQTTSQRIQLLEERKGTLTAELKAINERIMSIAKEEGSSKLDQIYQYRLRELEQVESELRRVELGIAAAQGRRGPAPTTAPSAPAAMSVEAIALLDRQTMECINQKRTLERSIEQMKAARMGESHPRLQEARAALAVAERSIEESAEAYRKAMAEGLLHSVRPGESLLTNVGLEELRSQERSIRAIYERVRQQTMDLGRKVVQVEAMRADADSVRAKLEETKTRIEELNVQAAVSGRVNVISSGDRPTMPDKDRRIPLAGVCGFGGFTLAIALAALIGIMDRRLHSVADARTSLKHSNRILGILPSLPDDLADAEQAAIAAHCVHQIRTLLQIHGRAHDQRVFAITSPSAGDGKTSLTLSLGLSFATSGARTLLIDCDVVGGGLTARMDTIIRRKIGQVLRREGALSDEQLNEALRLAQATHRRLGEVLVSLGYLTEDDLKAALTLQQESLVGLFDVLAGEPLMDCVMASGNANLYSLPLGIHGAQYSSQLSPSSLRRVLEEARRNFDVVLIDTGPVLGSLEASIAAAEADGVVLTVSRGEQRLMAEQAIEHLGSIGAKIAGIVFNRARVDDLLSSAYGSSVGARSITRGTIVRVENGPGVPPRMGPMASAVASVGRERGNRR